MNGNSPRLLSAFLCIALAGCAEGPAESPLSGTAWELQVIHEGAEQFTLPPEATPVRIEFTDEVVQDGLRRRLTGAGPCNLLAGSYRTAPPDSMRIHALASTRKACPEAVMSYETRLTRVLVDVVAREHEAQTLTLTTPQARVVFTRLPE